MCAEAPEVIRWILLLFQRVASSGNSSVIANESMCRKTGWDKRDKTNRNCEIFWCGSRKECTLETVSFCLLVTPNETF